MRSVTANTGVTTHVTVTSSKASASYCARSNDPATNVITKATARYGPGETRTLAMGGRFRASSRSSLTSASAGRLFNSFGSLICPLNNLVRTINRQIDRESAARVAWVSVTQVGQLQQRLRRAARGAVGSDWEF